MAKDLVCGMQVNEQQAVAKGLTSEYNGQTYYFARPAANGNLSRIHSSMRNTSKAACRTAGTCIA
jgi:YHS domain-containing protein